VEINHFTGCFTNYFAMSWLSTRITRFKQHGHFLGIYVGRYSWPSVTHGSLNICISFTFHGIVNYALSLMWAFTWAAFSVAFTYADMLNIHAHLRPSLRARWYPLAKKGLAGEALVIYVMSVVGVLSVLSLCDCPRRQ